MVPGVWFARRIRLARIQCRHPERYQYRFVLPNPEPSRQIVYQQFLSLCFSFLPSAEKTKVEVMIFWVIYKWLNNLAKLIINLAIK
jgi:hypothetical protein